MIRQTLDQHLMVFAQHLVLYRIYRDRITPITNVEYEQYIAMLSNLHRDAIRVLNEHGVNMYGNNINMDDLVALNTAETELTLLICFIHTYIDDDVDHGSQLAQMVAGLFLAPDTVTDDMMNIDNLPSFYRFFVYNFMMHEHLDEADVQVVDMVLEPYLYGDTIPYNALFNLENHTAGAVNHGDLIGARALVEITTF